MASRTVDGAGGPAADTPEILATAAGSLRASTMSGDVVPAAYGGVRAA